MKGPSAPASGPLCFYEYHLQEVAVMSSTIRHNAHISVFLLSTIGAISPGTSWSADKLFATDVLADGQVDMMVLSTDSRAKRDVLHTPTLTPYEERFHKISYAAIIRYGLGDNWDAALSYQTIPWSLTETQLSGFQFKSYESGSLGTSLTLKRGFDMGKGSAWSSSAEFKVSSVPDNSYTNQTSTLFSGHFSVGYDNANPFKPYARLSMHGSNRGSLRKSQRLTLGTEIAVLPQFIVEPGLRFEHLSSTAASTSLNEREWYIDFRTALSTDTYVLGSYIQSKSSDWQSGAYRLSNGTSHAVQLGLYHLFR